MADRKKVSALAVRDKQGAVEVADIAVKGENVENFRWKHIADRPFDLNSDGKIPKEKVPAVGWGEISDRPFDLDSSGKIPKAVLPSVSWADVTDKPTFTAAVFSAGAVAPADTNLLWIDTSGGGLKYWNGSAWVAVPVAYT